LRVDKLTIAALEVTLNAYLRSAWEEIPAQRMIRATVEELQVRVENFVERVQAALRGDAGARLEIADGFSLAGGGSTPDQTLASKLICTGSARHSAAQLERRLRRPATGPSVIARVEEDRVILDLRTVFPEQEKQLADALVAALG
jgi:L-seryl-tRNA(Ser) seleniumtransferase